MLKHVQNTLARRPSRPDDICPCPSYSSSSSPTPTISSGSSFNLSSSPSTSTGSGSGSTCLPEDALSLTSRSGSGSHRLNPHRSTSLDESSSCSSSSSSTTWKRCRTGRKGSLGAGLGSCKSSGSCLSIISNTSTIDLQENSISLRVYAGCLRPDIQYKTVGINSATTCEQVVDLIFKKCKLPFKDPKLFYLAIEMRMRGANGLDVDASIPLQKSAHPFQLQECYPNGQAKFCLQMHSNGSFVKVYDKTGTLGWDYKGVMISEKTTAGGLLDILFRFTNSSTLSLAQLNQSYTLHVEVDEEWNQKLESTDMIIPMQSIAKQFGNSTRLLLKSRLHDPSETEPDSTSPSRHSRLFQPREQQHSHPSTFRNSTTSLYNPISTNPRYSALSLPTTDEDDSSLSLKSFTTATEYWRRRKSHSLSSSSGQSCDSSGAQESEVSRTSRLRRGAGNVKDEEAFTDTKLLLNRFRRLGLGIENRDHLDVVNPAKYELSDAYLV